MPVITLKTKIPALANPPLNDICLVCRTGLLGKKDVLIAACQHRYHIGCVATGLKLKARHRIVVGMRC